MSRMSTVLLTGASGFLGLHTLQHLLDAGHHVRAYVRSPHRLEANLLPFGIELEDSRIEVAEGDMTSVSGVRTAAEGCDAVVHTAATFSYKRRDRERMARENSAGTRTILEAGAEAGARTLVHVSSTVALVHPGGGVIDHTSPLGTGTGPYSESKVASEAVARGLQEAGAPVTIVNPGGILGPHDPYLGENAESILQALKGQSPAWPRGSLLYNDVREVAATLTAAVDHDPGRRFIVPGHNAEGLFPVLREVTGRRLPAATLPPGLLVAAAMPGYLTGWSFLPGAVEGIRTIACANAADGSETTRELGIEARPFEQSVRDTVRWLVEAGHLKAKHAGKALS